MPLNASIHAEQFAVVTALRAGETALRAIATTAAPCGHCRQFMNELRDAATIDFAANDSKEEDDDEEGGFEVDVAFSIPIDDRDIWEVSQPADSMPQLANRQDTQQQKLDAMRRMHAEQVKQIEGQLHQLQLDQAERLEEMQKAMTDQHQQQQEKLEVSLFSGTAAPDCDNCVQQQQCFSAEV